MKRNTLMKRMAVVALAATMSIGMAVPAMAAPTTDKSSSEISGHVFNNETFSGGVTYDDEDVTLHNYTVFNRNTFIGSQKIYLDTLNDETKNQAHGTGTVGLDDTTERTTTSTATYTKAVEGTTKSDISPYIEYSVDVDHDAENADVALDSDAAEVTVTPEKWGTTFFKITEKFHYFAKANEDGSLFNGNVTFKNNTYNYVKDQNWNKEEGYTGDQSSLKSYMKDMVGAKADAGTYWNAYTTTFTYYVAYNTPFTARTLDEVVKSASGKVAKATEGTALITNVKSAVDAQIAAFDPKKTTITDSAISNVNTPIKNISTVVTRPVLAKDGSDVTANVSVLTGDHKAATLNGNYTFEFSDDLPYTDVTSADYYYDQVKQALADGAFTADSDTVFGANDTVSRADFVYAMWKKAGAPQVSPTDLFKDTDGLDTEHKEAINWAVNNHYAAGKVDGTFAPAENLTRAQVVQFLYKMAKDTTTYKDVAFSDLENGKWYQAAIKWATANGVVAGYTDNTFRPGNAVAKKDAAALLYRK